MMHFVCTFSIYACLRLIAVEEARNYQKAVYIKNIFQNGWWEEAYPSSCPPRSTPGHKLQKPSKESGIFQSLDTINFVNFLLKDKVKRKGLGGGGGRGWHNAPLNTLLTALHLFRDMIIIGKESSIAFSAF